MKSLKVENISKVYQLGQIGTGTLSRDLERWFAKVRGKEDPFLRIGERNDRTRKGVSDVVWSLKDINFTIDQGEAVGLIGRNGAGKSTLLKLISRVTAPTSGRISGNGRVASLLEVGTGFHPDLTGRENVYLNGAILGMRKKEIDRKFDEIVEFSSVERYIDTPVKRYSYGMYLRLAFAVAAHLESEILIIDEVLAVGDYDFQLKCLGKMDQLKGEHGRTLIFVSHNLESVNRLCSTSLWLDCGQLIQYGPTKEIISEYKNFVTRSHNLELSHLVSDRIQIISSKIVSNSEPIFNSTEFELEFTCRHLKEESLADNFFIEFFREGVLAFVVTTFHLQKVKKFEYNVTIKIPKYLLNSGFYSVNVIVLDSTGNFMQYLNVKDLFAFEIVDDGYRRGSYSFTWDGAVSPLLDIRYV